MGASIWDPEGSGTSIVPANTFTVNETFVATEGQTTFTFTAFTYTPGASSLRVFLNGVRITGIQELSTTQFALPLGCSAVLGDKVFVEAVLEEIAVNDPSAVKVVDLANQTDPLKGAGMVGFLDTLSYAAGTVGNYLAKLWKRGKTEVWLSDYIDMTAGEDNYAAFMQALAAVDTSGGKAGILHVPAGGVRLGSPVVVPDRVKIKGAGSRATIFVIDHAGQAFTFNGVTFAGISGARISQSTTAGTEKTIVCRTPGNVDCRWLEFKDLEIAPPELLSGQVGVDLEVSGTGIITECVFDDIKFYGVHKPIRNFGAEGNFFTRLTLAGFGATATFAIDAVGHANIYQGRIAGGPASGSAAYNEGGARNIVDLIVDIGPNSVALNVTGSANTIRLARPEELTPVGTYSATTKVYDNDKPEFTAKRLVIKGTTPLASSFVLTGFGSTAYVDSISGNDQRMKFTVHCQGSGIAAYPMVKYSFYEGALQSAPIVQVTRDGGNQNNAATGNTNASTDGWNFLFDGTPVSGEIYVFVVTAG